MLKARVVIHKWPTVELLEGRVVKKIKRYAEEIFNGVVERSPVDTGSYRASWAISVGVPVYHAINGGQTGTPMSAPSFVWPSGYKLGESIFITNGQPYAERLEYGWSQQAPHGVIRVTLASVSFR